MNLLFTKGPGKVDTLDIQRHDGSSERIQCPKQGIIPHDMVHYAVEHTLSARGFLNRVKEGEGAGFRMAPEAHSDSIERLVEALQGDAWSGGTSTEAEVLEIYRVTCAARECPVLPLSEAELALVRLSIQRLTHRWAQVPVHGTLSLPL